MKAYLISLNRYVLAGLVLIALLAAIGNNIRFPADTRLPWIGGQEVLPTPEDAL